MPSLSIKFGIRVVVTWTKLSAWMLCQERPGIPHTTGYFDILMRINLAPLLDHVMHQVLIMRYVHTRITFSSRITLQSCIALFLLVRKTVGINATWGVQSDGLIFSWSTFLFLFHSQVAASEHSCYQTVVVFNGQQLLLGVKVDKFSEPWNIKKKGISWNVKYIFKISRHN